MALNEPREKLAQMELPIDDVEKMKLAAGDVEQDGLFPIPAQIGAQEVNQPGAHGYPLISAIAPRHAFGVYGLIAGIDMPIVCFPIEVFELL